MAAAAAVIVIVCGALGFFGARTFLDSRQTTVVSADEEPSPSPSSVDDVTEPATAPAAKRPTGQDSNPGNKHGEGDESDDAFDPGSAIDADNHYTNPRYGFSIDLPEGWEAKTSDNTDGLTLTSPELSGKIVVYGTNMWPIACVDSGATTVSGCADARSAELEDEGFDITYQQTKDDWFVVSGSDGQGQGVYERWHLGPGSANALVVDFPMSEREAFDEITTDLSRTLSPGDLSVAH